MGIILLSVLDQSTYYTGLVSQDYIFPVTIDDHPKTIIHNANNSSINKSILTLSYYYLTIQRESFHAFTFAMSPSAPFYVLGSACILSFGYNYLAAAGGLN